MVICPFQFKECDADCALNRGGQCAITIMALTWASRFLEQKPKECPPEIVAFAGNIAVKEESNKEPQEIIYTNDDIPF